MFDYMMDEKTLKLRQEVREFVAWVPKQMILDMDEDKIEFPKEFLAEAGRRNLMGCRYPEKWGGRGMDWASTVMVMEEVGVLGYIFACVFGVGAELVCDAIILHGTDEQREKYVKPLLAGKIFSAECLTEPKGGSDFFGTTTKAEDKGDYFLVYARTNQDPQCDPHKALTCFIVDRSEGVETAYQYGLMGCRGGGAGRVVFKDVRVPRENVLGQVGGAYKVFNTMMIPERLGTAAMTIGAARPALDIATGYTTRRKAFGKTINMYQGVSFQVAEAAMLLDAARAMCYATAKAVDSNVDHRRIRRMVSETKKFVTESCQKAAHNAMQVMGGIGYTNIFPIERIVRDLRLASIWTGTNEVMSLIVASEWYKEYFSKKGTTNERDMEEVAAQADSPDEKVYE